MFQRQDLLIQKVFKGNLNAIEEAIPQGWILMESTVCVEEMDLAHMVIAQFSGRDTGDEIVLIDDSVGPFADIDVEVADKVPIADSGGAKGVEAVDRVIFFAQFGNGDRREGRTATVAGQPEGKAAILGAGFGFELVDGLLDIAPQGGQEPIETFVNLAAEGTADQV